MKLTLHLAACLASSLGLAVTSAAPVAYVSNTDSDEVWVIDMTCQGARAVIPVGNDPRGIDASADGSRVYVANRFDNSVSVIDTASNTVVQTIDLGTSALISATEPYDVAVSAAGTQLYVAMKNGGSENGDGTVVFVALPSANVVAEVL